MSVASVWGRVSVFSVGFGYVFFRVGYVAICSIDGRLMYAGGVSGSLALGAGSGVSLVMFCNELPVIYLLSFRQY